MRGRFPWLVEPEMNDFLLNEFLPYQLALLSTRISREFSDRYREKYGISISEWRILAHLSQAANPTSVREVFEQVAMDKSKVSRAAGRLHKHGLLKKSRSRADGRLVELSLSKAGMNLVRELTPTALEFEKEVLGRLGPQGGDFQAAVRKLCGLETH